MAREEASFNGDGGKLLSTAAYAPWHSAATATQARTGLSAVKAYVTAAGSEKSRTLVGSGWRTTETDQTFDGNGQVLTESRLGDTTKSGSLAITRRKQLPFGQTRSTQTGAFPGTRGFVGGTTDPTGLTHLGAREYDAALGRFISVDPLLITDDPRQHNAYAYSNNNPVTFSDPTGERLEECASGQYTCGHGGTRPTGYGKNYEMITNAHRGTLAPDYVRYKQRMQRACHHDPDCKSWDGSHRGNAARAKERAAAEAARKKAEAERRKKDGIFGSLMKGHFSDAWEGAKDEVTDFKNNLTDKQWWLDKGVGFIAAQGTAWCILAEPCGVAMFTLGAATLYVGGLGGHYALSSREGRRAGVGRYVRDTAVAEGVGIGVGSLCGKGTLGCLGMGAKAGFPLEGVSRLRMPFAAAGEVRRTVQDWMF